MLKLQSSDLLVLDAKTVSGIVPSQSGVYMLAIRLANGVPWCFHTAQTDDLRRSLHAIVATEAAGLPDPARELLSRFQPYFTFFVIVDERYRAEIEKLLTNTIDPVLKLTLVTAN